MIKKEIILPEQKITYSLRQSRRAKRLRLAVYCDGSVIITCPFGFSENAAESFVAQKINWLLAKIRHFQKFKYINIGRKGRKDYLVYKEKALALVQERISYFNRLGGFTYNKINIKRQKSRWGSCSKKRNLNFNYKIIFLPKLIQDYIIVHELCHLKEFNHSKNFWNQVAQIIPEYRQSRKELRKNMLI
jgi:hypothetical protein